MNTKIFLNWLKDILLIKYCWVKCYPTWNINEKSKSLWVTNGRTDLFVLPELALKCNFFPFWIAFDNCGKSLLLAFIIVRLNFGIFVFYFTKSIEFIIFKFCAKFPITFIVLAIYCLICHKFSSKDFTINVNNFANTFH